MEWKRTRTHIRTSKRPIEFCAFCYQIWARNSTHFIVIDLFLFFFNQINASFGSSFSDNIPNWISSTQRAHALIHIQQIQTRCIWMELKYFILRWQAKSKNKSISDENEINMSTTSVQATICTLSTPFHSPPSNLSSNHHEYSLLSLYFVYWIKFELNFHNDMALVVSLSLPLGNRLLACFALFAIDKHTKAKKKENNNCLHGH